MSHNIVKFGKYRGADYSSILKDDNYCKWLMGLTDVSNSEMTSLIDFIKGQKKNKIDNLQNTTNHINQSSSKRKRDNSKYRISVQMINYDLLFNPLKRIHHTKCEYGVKLIDYVEDKTRFQELCALFGSNYRGGFIGFTSNVNAIDLSTFNLVGSLPYEKVFKWATHIPSVYLGDDKENSDDTPPLLYCEYITKANVNLPSPYPYQQIGISASIRQLGGRVLIADDMGLGKTLQSIAIAFEYVREHWPLVIICPSSVKLSWREQLLKWLPGFVTPDDICVILKSKQDIPTCKKVYIISYTLYTKNKIIPKVNSNCVIVDECHYLKDRSTKRSLSILPDLRSVDKLILLTGTPIMNKGVELYVICNLMYPNIFSNFQRFASRYSKERIDYFNGTPVTSYYGTINHEELRLILSKFMIRRKKSDVLKELPPIIRNYVPIYEEKIEDFKEMMSENNLPQFDRPGISESYFSICKNKMPNVIEFCKEFLTNIDDEDKVIFFAHHSMMLDSIENVLPKNSYVRIDGKTPLVKRQEYINNFQTNDQVKIAILSITACSEGINLNRATHVVFCELYWTPSTMEQAEARAHRIGGQQNKCVEVHYLISKNTPDERVYALMERKKSDASLIVDGYRSTLLG